MPAELLLVGLELLNRVGLFDLISRSESGQPVAPNDIDQAPADLSIIGNCSPTENFVTKRNC